MLPKANRLTRPEFIRTKTSGKTYSFPHFSIVQFSYSSTSSKYSIVTSAKFHKSAVVRNSFRRQVYPLLLFNCKNQWLILYPKSSMLKLTRDQIDSLFASLLSPLFITPPGA